jgi:hypothetical protein
MMDQYLVETGKKLKSFADSKHLSAKDIASAWNVDTEVVQSWFDGRDVPRPDLQMAIQHWTNEFIMAGEWILGPADAAKRRLQYAITVAAQWWLRTSGVFCHETMDVSCDPSGE